MARKTSTKKKKAKRRPLRSDDSAASRKERFDILYNTLERYNARFVNAAVTMAAVLIVIIGWLLTSERAEELFVDSRTATVGALMIIGVLIWVYWRSMRRVYCVNHKAFRMLENLKYIDPDYYRHHFLSKQYYGFGIGLNVGIYVVIAVLITNAHWCILE